ncbi:MAG: carboxypeptidase regulatory-like domain-containing protein [Vicinamibacterales bacterium]
MVAMAVVPAFAQGTSAASITGTVKDSSGSVLPGVTVEVRSPALIEGVRSAITDDQGLYRIIELRPGRYSVTFALTGFTSLERQGVELSSNFTATVNAELTVGGLQESVTVTGQSPIVDVQNVTQQKTISQSVLSAVPTGKSVLGFIALMPAAATPPGAQDVGGSKGEVSMRMSLHGAKQSDQRMLQDGMTYNLLSNPTGRTMYVNALAAEEFVVEAGSGGSAEYSSGGAQVNLIPKDGGNVFAGTFFAGGATRGLQGTNLSDDLRDQGLTSVNGINHIYDANVVIGGPLVRNKLWFSSAHRRWGKEERIANLYHDADISDFIFTPDFSRPADAAEDLRSDNLRLTWQATPKHKFTFSYDWQKNSALNQAGGLNEGTWALEAVVRANAYCNQIDLLQSTWTFPASNNLLFDAGASVFYTRGSTGISFNCGGIPGEMQIREQSTGLRYHGAGQREESDQDSFSERFSMTYFAGAHTLRAGVQAFHTKKYSSYLEMGSTTIPANYTFNNGRPASLTQYVTPRVQGQELAPNLGLFIQDKWALGRLTINLGLRYDYLRAYAPAINQPAGFPFSEPIQYDEADCLPCWHDVNSRIGVSWDPFGNGRTAVKVGVGRYVEALGSQLAANFGPSGAIVTNTNRAWTDANFNFFPDCNLANNAANGECGAVANNAFGQVIRNTTPDPDWIKGWGKRGYNWQVSASVDHEVRPGFAVQAAYYRRWFGNFTVTDNTLVTPDDFDPYCITAPSDGRLGSISGSEICGFYDIKPEKFGQVANQVTLASNFGKQTEVYNGVDLNFSLRLPNGAAASGGWNIGNTFVAANPAGTQQTGVTFSKLNYCFVVDSPQQLYNCETQNPYQSRIKLNGSYPMPLGLQAAVVYQNLPAANYAALYAVSTAAIAPSLGRPLAGGTRNVTLDLLPFGSEYVEDRINQLDVRLSKLFRSGRLRWQANVDLYNVFNGNPVLQVNSTFGPNWLRPSQILDARLMKFSVQMDF